MAQRKKPPFRGDHIGSLLRPERLLEARSKMKAGQISAEELRDQENECIREVVKLQENAGLMSITDGEFRRESFHVDFIGQIKNVTSNWDIDRAFQLEYVNAIVRLGKFSNRGQNVVSLFALHLNIILCLVCIGRQGVNQQFKQK